MTIPDVRVRGAERPALRISIFYAVFFGMIGIYQPFFQVWMASRGLDPGQIGVVLALTMWLRVAINPAVTRFADWRGERRRYVLRFSVAAFVTAACFPFAEGFWPVFLIAIAFTATHGPTLPLSDNIALLTARARGLDYGRLRVWGSVAFIATSWLGGMALAGSDDQAAMYAIIAGLALVAVAAALLPDARPGLRDRAEGAVAALLRDGGFVLCALAVGFNMASHAVLMGFATLHWQAAGYGKDITGPLWAIGVISEVVLFALGGRIVDRLGIAGMIALGAGAAMFRWAGTALTVDLWLLVPIQMLHGITFGATHLGGMAYLQRRIRPGISATAQGLYSSFAMAGMTGLVMLAAGPLYERFGGGAFWFMAGLSAVSLGLSAVLARRPVGV